MSAGGNLNHYQKMAHKWHDIQRHPNGKWLPNTRITNATGPDLAAAVGTHAQSTT